MSDAHSQSGLDAQVRRADENRWLASRFAGAAARARLIALYALNDEIARAAEAAKEPALGDIRLAWWRDAVAALYAGEPAQHPVLDALALHRAEAGWSEAAVQALIEARRRDLGGAGFADWSAFDAHADATAGAIMRLALRACGVPVSESVEAFAGPASRAWAVIAWMRSGRAAPNGDAQGAVERALSLHAESKPHARAIAGDGFAAIGYVALIPAYARALARMQRETPLMLRQLALVRAAATGSV